MSDNGLKYKAWSQMADILDQEMPKSNAKPWLSLFLLLLALGLIGSIGLWYIQYPAQVNALKGTKGNKTLVAHEADQETNASQILLAIKLPERVSNSKPSFANTGIPWQPINHKAWGKRHAFGTKEKEGEQFDKDRALVINLPADFDNIATFSTLEAISPQPLKTETSSLSAKVFSYNNSDWEPFVGWHIQSSLSGLWGLGIRGGLQHNLSSSWTIHSALALNATRFRVNDDRQFARAVEENFDLETWSTPTMSRDPSSSDMPRIMQLDMQWINGISYRFNPRFSIRLHASVAYVLGEYVPDEIIGVQEFNLAVNRIEYNRVSLSKNDVSKYSANWYAGLGLDFSYHLANKIDIQAACQWQHPIGTNSIFNIDDKRLFRISMGAVKHF